MKLISGRRWFKASLVGAIATIGLSAFAQSVSAATNPYNPNSTNPGTTGYDVSYPQCTSTSTPSGYFGIVGVGGGRPFSQNSCVVNEYEAALKAGSLTPSLYINTGYSGAYKRDIIPDCNTQSQSASFVGTSAQRQAWAIGCSEAEWSMNYMIKAFGTARVTISTTNTPVFMWWLDVETANSWSSSDLTLNQYTINGAATELANLPQLAGTTLSVGVYSNAGYWTIITGGNFTPTGPGADWETAGGSCTAPGFNSNPVWLVQSTGGTFDSDQAC